MLASIVSRKAAEKFVNWAIPGLQQGGIVTSPTFAMIGEAGPEMVVPLNKLNNPDFIDRLQAATGGNARPINVNVNISTPDVSTFKTSQSQIAVQMAAAMVAAQRNI